MFLAIEEIRQHKFRYGLIVGLLILVAYLVFFLTGLAYGLMQQNRAAIDKWEAHQIVLSAEADKLLTASRFDASLQDQVTADELAPLYYQSSLAWETGASDEDKERVAVFGMEADSFLMPNLIEGRKAEAAFEVVVAETLLEELNLELGDSLSLAEVDQEVTIVGVTDRAYYSVAPVIYMVNTDFQTLYQPEGSPDLLSALVVKGEVTEYPESEVEVVALADFIEKLPGYRAQNLTFGFMIGFLIVISAVIIGIFIYVLTTQKAPIFGLMKIQGLSTAYIAGSVLGQTLLLAGIGTGIGFGLTYLSSVALPSAVPFENAFGLYGVIGVALLVFALLGASFSVISISKVDPLQHIG